MIDKAKSTLGEDAFHYEIIDFHAIPYPAGTFDVIISNHNLYFALDVNQVLGEISRVLKDDGVFYSTTNSIEHMASLRELVNIPDDGIWPNSVVASTFGTGNGNGNFVQPFPIC